MVLSVRIDLSRLGPSLILAATGAIGACVRPPLPEVCPDLAPGDLVLTEYRGPQTGSYRQWIELYNASDAPIDLAGISLHFEPLDGGEGSRFLVRDEDLVIEPGAYVVLGGGDPARFDYIDYDFTVDYHSSTNPDEPRELPSGGFVAVYSCDREIDSVLLRGLPEEGTLFWPGTPDAAANDDSTTWCVDDFTVSNTGTGKRGTPGEANPACPMEASP